jgi:hypothetical protein
MMRYLTLVLLLVLTACRAPFQRVEPELPPEVLPELPRQVVSPLGPIPVLLVDSLRAPTGELLDGGYHTERRVIYIRAGITSRARQWQVLRHEECHVVVDDAGLMNLIPAQLVQAICDAFATRRVAEMLAQAKR